jgi:poly-gamma-glutamate capsule biosynthesis protein CapA/YwtB (metallophosphatase superfamily)
MLRIMILVIALCAGAVRPFCAPLFVQTSDDLWPEWLHLISVSPLPAGTDAIRLPPGFDAPGDHVIMGLGGAGRVVGLMPRVPVVRLGDERLSATGTEVARGAIQTLPLCAVSLPEVALPLDGIFPDQPGYALRQDVTLQLESSDRRLRGWYAKLPSPAPWSGAPISWIEAVGDIMPARGVDQALMAKDGLERVFGNTLALLRGSSFLLGNLESSAARTGTAQDKSYTFRFRAEAVEKLKEAGFSYLSLANNHTFDFGRDGFLQTLAGLSRWGVVTSGAGSDLQQASRPAVVHIGQQEVRVLSFGDFPVDRTGFDGRAEERASDSRPGILWLDGQGLEIASRAFCGRGSFNIAFVHGGREWSVFPTSEQKRLYRELIRNGANLVIGAHPHVLEGMEAFDGSLIAYSLGNFLFPGMAGTPGGQDSVILRLGVYNGKIRYVLAYPVRLQGRTVSRAPDERARNLLMSRTRVLAREGVRPDEGWQKTVRQVF